MSIYRQIFDRELLWKSHASKQRFTMNSSSYFVQRFQTMHVLEGHSGCINSVLFSEDGSVIYTGSDDTNVNIYETESGKLIESLDTLHNNNIFYAKDMNGSDKCLLVTCAADGRVVLTNLKNKKSKIIYRHKGRAHRIAMYPNRTNQFFSCGEDGFCCLFDLRNSSTEILDDGTDEAMFTPVLKTTFNNSKEKKCSIYSISVNPRNTNEVAIGGGTSSISLYDVRKFDKPFGYLCPPSIPNGAHITGLRYNFNGELLIGSYNDEDIYCFHVQDHFSHERYNNDTNKDDDTNNIDGDDSVAEANNNVMHRNNTQDNDIDMEKGGNNNNNNNNNSKRKEQRYLYKYYGHRNSDTVKQVNFFGSHSEYVVSGSDCGHIFIWDTYTTKLIKLLKADDIGAVNCLATHPNLPYLGSSGLQETAKIWAPIGEYNPILINGNNSENNDIECISNNNDNYSNNKEYQYIQRVLRENDRNSDSYRSRNVHLAELDYEFLNMLYRYMFRRSRAVRRGNNSNNDDEDDDEDDDDEEDAVEDEEDEDNDSNDDDDSEDSESDEMDDSNDDNSDEDNDNSDEVDDSSNNNSDEDVNTSDEDGLEHIRELSKQQWYEDMVDDNDDMINDHNSNSERLNDNDNDKDDVWTDLSSNDDHADDEKTTAQQSRILMNASDNGINSSDNVTISSNNINSSNNNNLAQPSKHRTKRMKVKGFIAATTTSTQQDSSITKVHSSINDTRSTTDIDNNNYNGYNSNSENGDSITNSHKNIVDEDELIIIASQLSQIHKEESNNSAQQVDEQQYMIVNNDNNAHYMDKNDDPAPHHETITKVNTQHKRNKRKNKK